MRVGLFMAGRPSTHFVEQFLGRQFSTALSVIDLPTYGGEMELWTNFREVHGSVVQQNPAPPFQGLVKTSSMDILKAFGAWDEDFIKKL